MTPLWLLVCLMAFGLGWLLGTRKERLAQLETWRMVARVAAADPDRAIGIIRDALATWDRAP